MNWEQWIYGLVNAIISGAANSVTVMIVDPEKFNLTSWKGFEHMGAVAGVGATVGFWMYLKQSPLPTMVKTTVTTQQTMTVSEKALEVPTTKV